MCPASGRGISRVDNESTGARPMNRIRARAANIFDANPTYTEEPAPRKVFNANEYNPLRNPGHFSDSKHLANRGLMPENSLPQLDARSSSQQQRPRDIFNRETRVDLNSKQYKDSLEQYVGQQIDTRGTPVNRSVSGKISGQLNNPVSAEFRSSLPVLKSKQGDGLADLEFKGNYANFYGTEDPSTRKFIYEKVQPENLRQSADQNKGRRAMMAAKPKNGVDEQTQFMNQALSSNILLKRDAEKFFTGGEAQDSASGFVRNYNEFYRGSTPDDKLKQFLDKKEGSRKMGGPDKKKDVYLYNFFLHKPKYVYTTDENRMKKKEDHYGKFANKADFKSNVHAFFAVEHEFPKPDYNRRGPIQKADDAHTLNRVYGGKVPVHL